MDVEKLRLPQNKIHILKPAQTKKSREYGRYIKGPIPLDWIICAAQLGGKTVNLALALWYLKGLQRSDTVILTHKMLREFGVSVNTSYRLLERMEGSGLVRIKQQPGSAPRVTIMEAIS